MRDDGESGNADNPANVRRCVDCGAASPVTETNYTLISPAFGWRLCKRFDASGERVLEWRCPNCWERYKKKRGQALP